MGDDGEKRIRTVAALLIILELIRLLIRLVGC
jgi:hypothetical protein